jgi:hypothetical protein|tara:strand:+ start:1352 stop:2044 length:693 start_codon:yes stop_codon:yes gene_type:complete
MEDLNNQIATLVRSYKDDFYADKGVLSYVKRYTGCDDFLVSDNLIKGVWEFFEDNLLNLESSGYRKNPSAISVLHTNSGAGKILEESPKNVLITAFNNDMVCKRITDYVCQDRGLAYGGYIRDISQYFAVCNTNSSRKYDIVITQPLDDMTFYKGVDSVGDLSECEPLEYYTTRSVHFASKNGYIVVIYPPNKYEELGEIVLKLDVEIQENIQVKGLEYVSYEALILKKN